MGADVWTPEHVTAALHAGALTAGALDVVLVGVALGSEGARHQRRDLVHPGDSSRRDGGRCTGRRGKPARLT